MPNDKTLSDHLAYAREQRRADNLKAGIVKARQRRTIDQMRATLDKNRKPLKPCNCGATDGKHPRSCPVGERAYRANRKKGTTGQ